MNFIKKAGILMLATTFLYSCHTVEPEIDVRQLILGTWNETSARDNLTYVIDKDKSMYEDLTNQTYRLVFKEDLKFDLFSNKEKLDSGTYFFQDFENQKYLYTVSADNIRIPKPFEFERKMTKYKVVNMTMEKLILSHLISETVNNETVILVHEFIWELSK